jgi:hypothetical protein
MAERTSHLVAAVERHRHGVYCTTSILLLVGTWWQLHRPHRQPVHPNTLAHSSSVVAGDIEARSGHSTPLRDQTAPLVAVRATTSAFAFDVIPPPPLPPTVVPAF